MEPKRYAMVKDNVVVNVCMWNGDVATWQPPADAIMIPNDWVGPGDWWEESEQRFYRALPTNTDLENTAEEQSV
jgi:hypothetical protein